MELEEDENMILDDKGYFEGNKKIILTSKRIVLFKKKWASLRGWDLFFLYLKDVLFPVWDFIWCCGSTVLITPDNDKSSSLIMIFSRCQ